MILMCQKHLNIVNLTGYVRKAMPKYRRTVCHSESSVSLDSLWRHKGKYKQDTEKGN